MVCLRDRTCCEEDPQTLTSAACDLIPMPQHPNHDVPKDPEQPELPVEPDEGPVPPSIPDDAEHERVIDPAAMRPELPASSGGSRVEGWAAASSRAR